MNQRCSWPRWSWPGQPWKKGSGSQWLGHPAPPYSSGDGLEGHGAEALEDLFNGRNLDAYLELLDPAVEWHVSPEDPDTTVHHGREAVRAYVEGWVDAFADLRIRTEVVSEVGDRVLTIIRFTGWGTGSDTPLDERVSFLFSLRAGRVAKVDDLGRVQASTK